jgi:hypothetical protein
MDTQLAFPDPEDSIFGPVVYVYTRARAIADGVLVDATGTAKEAGFKLPVAITEVLHNRLTPTKADAAIGQDYDGRLWDVLWLAAFTIKLADPSTSLRAGPGTEAVNFTVVLQEAEARSGQPQNIDLRLRAVCGPGDEGEPVITIGFPEDF